MTIRPFSRCHPTQAVAGPIVSTQSWGANMGDFQISGFPIRSERKLHINVLELKTVTLALQQWVSVLQGHQVMITTDNTTCCSLYQQKRWDPFPCHNPQQTSFPVYVSSSRATRTGDRCSVTRLAGMDDVQVSTISPAQQSHSEAQDDPGGQVIPSASMEALM